MRWSQTSSLKMPLMRIIAHEPPKANRDSATHPAGLVPLSPATWSCKALTSKTVLEDYDRVVLISNHQSVPQMPIGAHDNAFSFALAFRRPTFPRMQPLRVASRLQCNLDSCDSFLVVAMAAKWSMTSNDLVSFLD